MPLLKDIKISIAVAVALTAAASTVSCSSGQAGSWNPTYAVEDAPGYNCWPMIQPVGERLVCVYTIGKAHAPAEKGRATYARYSDDGGVSWSERRMIFHDEDCGTSSIGKGVNLDGAALFWVRRLGIEPRMALYRTRDGVDFELISAPVLEPNAMQITDVFATPEGLMCMWFSDDYSSQRDNKSWGSLLSRDNGATWEQTVIEDDLPLGEWPTEPSVVVFGDGRLLAIGRAEGGGSQFQLTSTDWGKTWSKTRTNIDDVLISTPSLIYDAATGLISNYYFERGKGCLKRRVADAEAAFIDPRAWGEPEIVAWGNMLRPYDSGNANAVQMGNRHLVTYYAGDEWDCKVLVASVGDGRGLKSKAGRRILMVGDTGDGEWCREYAHRRHCVVENYGKAGSDTGDIASQLDTALLNIPALSVDEVMVVSHDAVTPELRERIRELMPQAKIRTRKI